MRKITNELTKREAQLIEFLKLGYGYDKMSKEMNLSNKLISTHLSELRKKTNSFTNTMLINKYDKKEIYEVSP